jgi:hypothetical protein
VLDPVTGQPTGEEKPVFQEIANTDFEIVEIDDDDPTKVKILFTWKKEEKIENG